MHGAAQLIADSEAKACELALAKSFSEYPVRMTLKEQDDARADCDQLRADRDYTRPLLDEMEALERELADAQAQAKLWEDKCHDLIAPHYILDPCLRASKFREALQYHPVLPRPFWKKYGGPNDT